jgi:hypothetical protein
VYDGIGKDTIEANLDSLAPCGVMLIYGQASGFIPPFDLMTLMEKGSLLEYVRKACTPTVASHSLLDPEIHLQRCSLPHVHTEGGLWLIIPASDLFDQSTIAALLRVFHN